MDSDLMPREMTVDEALAMCFANLKGPRDKDLLGTAKALQFLRSQPGYGSNAKVAQVVGVSGEIVREFLALLRLPSAVQSLLNNRQLSLDKGRRLWQLGRKRPDLLDEVAREMVDLSVIDARHLVDYLLRHPDISVPIAKEKLSEAKTTTQREYHVVAILAEDSYRMLKQKARKRKQAVNELVQHIVENWLETNDSNE